MKEMEKAVLKYYKKIARRLGKTTPPEIIGLMTGNYSLARETQRRVDQATLTAIQKNNISVIERFNYLAFGRAVWGRASRFGGNTLERELLFLRQRWQNRGLDMAILEEIEQRVRQVLY
ncbi:MAG: hypothetical protein ABIK23_08390 [candidate division WOR-3 bacterium]